MSNDNSTINIIKPIVQQAKEAQKQFEKSISAVNNLWLSACKIDPELR